MNYKITIDPASIKRLRKAFKGVTSKLELWNSVQALQKAKALQQEIEGAK